MIAQYASAENQIRTRTDAMCAALMILAHLDRVDALIDVAIRKCEESSA